MSDKLIEIGYCGKAHGVTGGFSFHLTGGDESVLKEGMNIMLVPKTSMSNLPKGGVAFQIEKISFGNKVIAYLSGITSKNQVDEMLPFAICVFRSQFPELPEGEYYLSDLEGMDVFDQQSGKKVGYVSGTYDNGAQPILVVRGERKIWELPFVDNFFPDVDLENRKITMVTPEEINAY